MKEISQKLNGLIIEKFGISESTITAQSAFIKDFGVDSLDLYEFFMAAEKLFDITITDEQAEKMTTVGQLEQFIVEQKH